MNKRLDVSCWHAGFDQCEALEDHNNCSTSCPFYITAEDSLQSLLAANRRLRTLPEEQQARISRKYYDNERPWITGGKDG
jgi:hypothetical protein